MSDIPFRPTDDVVRSIPGLRVEGYHTTDAARLASAFSGPLKQFYLSQAQNHALGGVDQSAKFVDRGDFQMRYLNQFGNETVTLYVSEKVAGQVLKTTPWDWAVIDFDLPWVPYTYKDTDVIPSTQLVGGWQGVYARCVGPPIDPQTYPGGYEYASAGVPGTADEYKWSREGLDVVSGDETKWKPFVAWAASVFPTPTGTLSADIDRRSLRIDLRDYPTTDALIFDIYGAYPAQNDFIHTLEPRVGAVLTGHYDTPAPKITKNLEVFTGWSEAQVLGMYPELIGAYDTLTTGGPFPGSGWDVTESFASTAGAGAFAYSTDFGSNSYVSGAWSGFGGLDPSRYQISFLPVTDKVVKSVGTLGYHMYKHVGSWWTFDAYPTSFGSAYTLGVMPPPSGDGNFAVFDLWAYYIFMPHDLGELETPILCNQPATINATMFRGTPPWVEDLYHRPFDNNAVVWEWDIVGQSERFGLGQIATAGPVARYDLTTWPDHVAEDHHFGLKFLGKLIVSPTEGYVSFTPA